MRFPAFTAAALLLALVATASVHAQTEVPESRAVELDAILIEGEAQRPQASYILQRSNRISLSDDLKSKAPRFSQRIQDTLQDDVFEARP